MTSFLPILPSHRVGTLAVCMVLTVLATPASAQQKPTVSPADYGRFENLGGATLSPDGRWIAYGVRRVNDETELRVKSLALDSLWTMPWASNPTFSADGHWLAWTVGVSGDERKRLEKAEEPVRNGAGLMNLATGEERTFEKVASFDFDASGRYLVVHGYAPEEPEGKGADLRVVGLEAGTETAFGNVGEYAWSDVGSMVALALATGEAQGNGVQAYDAPTGRLVSLETSEASYAHLAWREDAADLAVLRSVSPAGEDGAAHDALAWRGLDRGQPEHLVLRVAEAGVPDSLELVEHSAPRWSDDGMRIAIGLRPAEPSDDEDAGAESADSTATAKGDQEEELAGLQIWHTSDVRIVPQQQASASRDERRTLLAVWHMDRGSVTQVGTDLLESAELLEGWNLAVESLSAPYPWGAKFGRPYNDVWLVDVASGERERVLERVRYSWESPGGGYLLSFDGEDYWSYDVQSSRRVNLTEGVPATFADTLYDTPTDLLPPHGVGGWLQNDGAVLLYDRFDVWHVSPDGSGATRLTRGAEEDLVHRVHDLDREEEAIDPSRPIFLSLRGEWTEQRGYARILPGERTARRLILEPKRVSSLSKADSADVYLFRQEARDDSPDYFVAGANLSSPDQVTAINPFAGEYAWGRAELFEFENEAGRRLQSGLLYPARHDPSRRYPMIVYTYEILSPQIHSYEVLSERDYYNFTAWTQQGYFVLLPDIVYRAREPGISAIESVRPAVAKVVEMGLVDSARVGLIGHSWGGYQATFLPTRTDIFAASVAGAPLTDFVSMMGAIHWNPGIAELSHWETGQARMDVPFWEDPDAHRRNSPVHKVHEMETPLLMAFGNEDGVVDWDQGTQFYNFARRAGKQMVLLVYEGEDHGFRTKANQVDYHRRILEWFGHYLKGEPAPTWITDGISVDKLEEETRRVADQKDAATSLANGN